MRPDGLGEFVFREYPDGGAPELEEEQGRHTAFNALVRQ